MVIMLAALMGWGLVLIVSTLAGTLLPGVFDE
jgi:hypothetical protein